MVVHQEGHADADWRTVARAAGSLAYTTGDLGLPQDSDLARQLAAEAEHALPHVANQ